MTRSIARKRPSPRGPSRLRWRVLLILAPAVALAGGVGLGLAATCRPTWYGPESIDRAQLHSDKQTLVSLLDGIGDALNNGRAASFQLPEAQVNRWITARAEMWPEAAIDLGEVQRPVVLFEDGRIRVGAMVGGEIRAVVGLSGHVDVTEDEVVLHLDGAWLGALPMPLGWLADMLAESPLISAGVTLQDGGERIAIRNDWVWPNGKRRYRLAKLRTSEGTVEVTLEPMDGRR